MQQCRTYRYKSLKSLKIDNIDLTQQFSLSIFIDFRYQSIKITWLLSIFIDTDFYRLTTPGQQHKIYNINMTDCYSKNTVLRNRFLF